ncbi:MAG: methyltransferase domain-containing protein [Acidimicrobiaceae bacterium]|nr:class I SAM-dependent methyltransferase [Acidimicrobiaceae bacterium]MDE0517853.1 class I SAM-dependent methyltransferase [Acidimicrobiaceae bacterium]MDE0656232.1 class I SAM-dependent methyltransferase [Acidimicrobiaceae bacterium]MXZ97340.1 methyltransferase domain-containing protein [Acidimicrobiaceae bacterium]MYF44543.1 methyltransferase domain-containing protein [Acidimicrobiaceae bacterium]
MSAEPRDAPYPELKKTHTMAHVGRPFTDYKPPAAAPVWAVIEGLGRYHVLLAALEIGVFEALDEGPYTGMTAEELAGRLDLPELHLEALLDSVVALGLLDRVVDHFRLNDAARRYLLVDGAASMAGLIPVAPGPHENWTRLADTVRSGRPATPIDDDPAAFYVPLVEGTFTTMWRCATRADFKMRYSALAASRILDLGAGGAPWSIAMLEACADGRATVNDLDGVIGVARRKTAEHGVTDRCEFRPGDFHTIPIEDGAYDIVILGHVCRTEGPDGARHLVERAYAALRPEGRVVLADYFIGPNHKTNPHAVLMGMTMMASTVNGSGVTTDVATGWLRDAGFEAIRLIEPIGFQFAYVASKPRD